MASEETVCKVDVVLNGHPHQVVVSGNNSPAFGFDTGGVTLPGPVPLRLRCEVCNGAAKLAFSPPSASWRRPYVVRRVIHLTDE